MKRYLIIFLIFIISGLSMVADAEPNQKVIDGFRNMKWDFTLDEAKAAYPDLTLKWKSSGPNVGYIRTNEELSIGETVFDDIRYSFKNNKFNKVMAIMEINILGRLESDVRFPSQIFNDMKKLLEAKYGPATRYKEEEGEKKFGIEPLFRKHKTAEWIIGENKVVLDLMDGSDMKILEKNEGKKGRNDTLLFSIEHIVTTNLGF